jgi:hypothetical protein
MKLKYFLCAIGYDAEGYVTDFEETLAEFEDEREARIAFDKFIWNENANEHFKTWTSVRDIYFKWKNVKKQNTLLSALIS